VAKRSPRVLRSESRRPLEKKGIGFRIRYRDRVTEIKFYRDMDRSRERSPRVLRSESRRPCSKRRGGIRII